MKKIFISLFLLILLLANVSVPAQITVNSSGLEVAKNVYIGGASNFFGTTGNTPIIFKVSDTIAAGYTGYSGNSNVSFGYGALSNPLAGFTNVAVGYEALYSNTAGYENTANGCKALFSNATGSSNTAIGNRALYANTTGYYNTANGVYSLISNTTGYCNTASGVYSLFPNNTGNGNTANGVYSLMSSRTGNHNTAVGYYSDVNADNLNNTTAIGYNAKATASDQVRIGNSTVISIGGYAAWSNLSDGRAKKNIREDVPGLDFINRLQPVTYNLDLDVVDELLKSDDPKINHFRDSVRAARSPEEKAIEAKSRANKEKMLQTGFVAQDVEETAKRIGYDFSGVDVDEMGIYGLRYAEFVVPLVKAVQELSGTNDAKDAAIASLQEQANEFIEALKEQKQQIEKQQIRNEELQAQINELIATCCVPKLHSAEVVEGIDGGKGSVVNVSVMEEAKLYQNMPNPFNQSTQIKFYIPETVSNAMLCIYDLQGRQLKQTALTQRGYGIETVFASEFQAGIYLYAMIADGNQVDVKRMILTE